VVITGVAVGGWRPVTCAGVPGFVFADFVRPGTPPVQETPTATEATLPTEAEPTAVPPEPTPTSEPVVTSRTEVITVASDTSVAATAPDTAQAREEVTSLRMGGGDQALTTLTFDVQGIAPGTVAAATLVVTGSGNAGAPGGELRVIPGAWVDESSATWNQVAVAGAANAGWIDWIEPGMEARVDITSVVRGDGTITFVLVGAPDQIATIASRESATPPRLEIVIEEGTAPGE